MSRIFIIGLTASIGLASVPVTASFLLFPAIANAQDTAAPAPGLDSNQDNPPLDEDELAVLVARIALYPDDLVALISSASLYPLDIVQAARFVEKLKGDKGLKPEATWDGSVISLLNYPEIVTMMSDDLEWTQALGDALVNQQQDVLIAIQQLRNQALANGIIKTDDKLSVTQSNDNVVIAPVKAEEIYVPQYAPEMLYEPGYAPQPIDYYPSAYPNYEFPNAPYFAAAVTGLAFAAVVDWDDWGVWGGHWGGGDIDIDCNQCLNNINGRFKLNDIDWKNVDRDKIKFDHDQFAKLDKSAIKDRIKANSGNNLKAKAQDLRGKTAGHLGDGHKISVSDIRKSKVGQVDRAKRPAGLRPGGGQGAGRQGLPVPSSRPHALPHKPVAHATPKRDFKRPAGKPRMGAHADLRHKKPSALGHVGSGRKVQMQSHRGHKAMGGGHHRSGGHKPIKHRGGRHR